MSDEFVEGFSVYEDMWHDPEGTWTQDHYPADIDEAMGMAGHRWTAVERPVWVDLADPSDDAVDLQLAESMKALVRQDEAGNTKELLSVVSKTYEVAQPILMWEVLEALVKPAPGDTAPPVRYETAGNLRDYKLIWALAKVEREFFVDKLDSPIVPYIAMLNSYDGTTALRALPTGVRIVCKNTWDAAVMGAKSSGYSFRHTVNMGERIEEAKAVITGVVNTVQEFVEMSRELLAMRVTPPQIEGFLERFVPMPVTEAVITDRAAANIREARQAVKHILAGGTGTILPHQSETAYGLVNAATEYLDHVRKAQTWQSRFKRAVLEPDGSKAKVVEFAREAARV